MLSKEINQELKNMTYENQNKILKQLRDDNRNVKLTLTTIDKEDDYSMENNILYPVAELLFKIITTLFPKFDKNNKIIK